MPTSRGRLVLVGLALALLVGCYIQEFVDDEEVEGAVGVDDDDDQDDDEPWQPQRGGNRGGKEGSQAGTAGGKSKPMPSAKARAAAQSAHLPDDDDDDEEQLDEDEFEGFEAQQPSGSAQQPPPSDRSSNEADASKGKRESKAAQSPPVQRELRDFIPEMVALALFVVYILNYFYGNAVNKGIAQEWLDTCLGVLEENFALVGIDNCRKLDKEGAAAYTLYCSGRQNCESMMVYLELQSRHDLISMLADLFRKRAEDKIILEIIMGDGPETGASMESYNFAVCPKGEEARLREENRGLESTTVAKRWKTELHDSLVCISDEEEVTRELLPDTLVYALNQHRQYLCSIIASDKLVAGYSTHARARPAVKMEFNLFPYDRYSNKEGGHHKPRSEKLRTVESLMRVGLRYIDKAVTYQMSSGARERMKKIATQLAEMEFKKSRAKREQEAQARKLEKLRKEKEAIEAMSPEAAAKYEERMLKKQRKNLIQAKATKVR